jgi:hypothetical protein
MRVAMESNDKIGSSSTPIVVVCGTAFIMAEARAELGELYIYICIHVLVCMYVCMYTCTVHKYVYTNVYIYVYIYICMSAYMPLLWQRPGQN